MTLENLESDEQADRYQLAILKRYELDLEHPIVDITERDVQLLGAHKALHEKGYYVKPAGEFKASFAQHKARLSEAFKAISVDRLDRSAQMLFTYNIGLTEALAKYHLDMFIDLHLSDDLPPV